MKAKIDWYKEVLELEPGSKVFFPLARLLAENGQMNDALSVLRLGLERHPEFIEARLYLIELLHQQGESAQCEQQVGRLARLFSAYPGFWEAWGMYAGGDGNSELPVALKLLSLLFRRGDIRLSDVLEQGLRACIASPSFSSPPPPRASSALRDEGERRGPPVAPGAPGALGALGAAEGPSHPSHPSRPSHPGGASFPARATPSEPKIPVPAANDFPKAALHGETEEAEEEPFTLRTRSMADVLAEQGDVDGALEIYRELASRPGSPEEREEIKERITQLSASRLPADEEAVAPKESHPGKQRLQYLLESLAERLEARAAE
jgi:tetratricopeptide (TPR) repeat protein